MLLTRKTLCLWLIATLNCEQMEDGRFFGYVSLYPCPTPVFISTFFLQLGSGEQAQYHRETLSIVRIELKMENASSLG